MILLSFVFSFFFDHCFGDTILRESSTCTINIIQDARYSIVSEQVYKYNISCGMTHLNNSAI